MKLNKKTIFNFLFLFLGVLSIGTGQGVNFANTSLSNLKKGSKETKKPYLVYLYDQNCDDCLRVEQMTLADPIVAETINDHLFAAKVDFVSTDGQKLRDKNKLSLAPSFLFYNEKGKLLLQQETAMSSDAMLKLLNVLYDLDVDVSATKNSNEQFENTKHIKVTAPQELSNHDAQRINQLKVITDQRVILKKPRKSLQIKAAKIPILSNVILNKAKRNNLKSPGQLFDLNYKEVPAALSLVRKQPVQRKTSANNVSNSRSVSAQITKSKFVNSAVTHKTIIHTYVEPAITRSVEATSNALVGARSSSIQFAAYTKYDDVLKGMYKMKRKISSPLTIVEEYTKGKLMYKLISSELMSTKEAYNQKKIFENQGIDCFVRKNR